MAKKVVMSDQKSSPKQKKKKSCCLRCFLTTLIVVVVVLGGAIGVGWYFGDQFTTANFDMSLGECLGVVNNLYGANEKKIVEKPYAKEDLDDFYKQLKNQLFLKEDVELDAKTVIDLIMGTEDENAQLESPLSAYGIKTSAVKNEGSEGEGDGDGGEEQGNEDSSQSTDKILNFILGLFTVDNIDYERLENYETDKHDDYLLKIKDKGLAAFINDILPAFLPEDITSSITAITGEGNDDIAKYVKLNQIVLSDRTATVEGASKQVSTLKLTAQLKVDALKKDVIYNMAPSGLAGLADFAAGILLPDNLFLSVTLGLNENIGTIININKLDTDEKMGSLYKLVKGITRMTGEELDLKKTIDDTLTEQVYPIMETAGTYLNFASITEASGAMTVDPFAMVIEFGGLNEGKEEDEKLTSEEMLFAISRIVSSTPDGVVQPEFDYTNWYELYDPDTGVTTSEYKPVDLTDEYKLIDYQDEFLKELSKKYLFDLTNGTPDDTSDDITFADVMAMFGVGESEEGKELDLKSLIDMSKLDGLLDKDDDPVNLTDQMLGAMVAALLDTVFGTENDIADAISVGQIIVSKDTKDDGDHNFIELGIYIDIDKMLEGQTDDMMSALLDVFIRSNNIDADKAKKKLVIVSIKMDITKGLDAEKYVDTEVMYNTLSAADTDRVLSLISKFGVELGIDAIKEQVEKPLRDMLDQMNDVIEVKYETSKIVLPSLFKIMEQMLFTPEGEDPVVSDVQIRAVLQSLNIDSDFYDEYYTGFESAAKDYDNFLGEVEEKYYFTVDTAGEGSGFDKVLSAVSVDSFESTNFNIGDLKYDDALASDLTPTFSTSELAALFIENMGEALDGYGGIKGIKIVVEKDPTDDTVVISQKLIIVAELAISEVIEDEEAQKMLPVDMMYMQISIDLALVKYYNPSDYSDIVDTAVDGYEPFYDAKLVINDMEGGKSDRFASLMAMINHLMSGSTLDFEDKAIDIGAIVYDQFNSLSDSLDGGFEITEDGIKLMPFYDFLLKTMKVDGNGEVAKKAVQGLFAKDDSQPNDNSFDNAPVSTNPVYGEEVNAGNILGFLKDESVDLPNLQATGTLVDSIFAKLIAPQFESEGGGKGVGELKEIDVLVKGDTSAKAAALRNWLNAFDAENQLDAAKSYLAVVLDIDMTVLGGDNDKMGELMPTSVTLTVVLESVEPDAADNYFAPCFMRINGINKAEQDLLFDLLGIETTDGSEIQQKIDDSLDILSEYATSTLVLIPDDETVSGVGAIKSTFDIAMP